MSQHSNFDVLVRNGEIIDGMRDRRLFGGTSESVATALQPSET